MIGSISSVTPAQPAVPAAAAPAPSSKSAQGPSDTVQISTTAKALLQETMETTLQTAREARGGDLQAVRLLAKQAAAHASSK
jgi:hypothetical protein